MAPLFPECYEYVGTLKALHQLEQLYFSPNTLFEGHCPKEYGIFEETHSWEIGVEYYSHDIKVTSYK